MSGAADDTWVDVHDGLEVVKKRGRGRPPGSKDKKPRKKREVKPPPSGGGRTGKRKRKQELANIVEQLEAAEAEAEMWLTEDQEVYDYEASLPTLGLEEGEEVVEVNVSISRRE